MKKVKNGMFHKLTLAYGLTCIVLRLRSVFTDSKSLKSIWYIKHGMQFVWFIIVFYMIIFPIAVYGYMGGNKYHSVGNHFWCVADYAQW